MTTPLPAIAPRIEVAIGILEALEVGVVTKVLVKRIGDVVKKMGLPLDYMDKCHDLFTSSFKTWMDRHELCSIHLEVYDKLTNICECRLDISICYLEALGPNSTPIFSGILNAQGNASLPAYDPMKYEYRVLVTLKDGAKMLPGWEWTKFKDLVNTRVLLDGSIMGQFMNINAQLIIRYRGV